MVKTVTLDEELAELSRLDFLKIDIEGADLLALRGATRLISKFQPIIVLELDEPQAQLFGYVPRTQSNCCLIVDTRYSATRYGSCDGFSARALLRNRITAQ